MSVRLGPPSPHTRREFHYLLAQEQLASPQASTVAFILGVLDLCPWAAFLLETAVGITSQSPTAIAALGRLHALATKCLPMMVSRHQILRLGCERHKWQQSWLAPGRTPYFSFMWPKRGEPAPMIFRADWHGRPSTVRDGRDYHPSVMRDGISHYPLWGYPCIAHRQTACAGCGTPPPQEVHDVEAWLKVQDVTAAWAYCSPECVEHTVDRLAEGLGSTHPGLTDGASIADQVRIWQAFLYEYPELPLLNRHEWPSLSREFPAESFFVPAEVAQICSDNRRILRAHLRALARTRLPGLAANLDDSVPDLSASWFAPASAPPLPVFTGPDPAELSPTGNSRRSRGLGFLVTSRPSLPVTRSRSADPQYTTDPDSTPVHQRGSLHFGARRPGRGRSFSAPRSLLRLTLLACVGRLVGSFSTGFDSLVTHFAVSNATTTEPTPPVPAWRMASTVAPV
jgi:hypothetical protein